jgi:hypothetical protein
MKVSDEDIRSRVSQVFERAMAAQVRELDGAVQAAESIPGGYHKPMTCECTSPTRGRVCHACQFKRGPIPKSSE